MASLPTSFGGGRRWLPGLPRLAALLLLMIGLGGCGSARLMLPDAEPEATLRTFVRERMRAARREMIETTACYENTALHTAMRDVMVDLVSHPDAERVSPRTLETIYQLGARSDGPAISMAVHLTEGDGEVVLLAASWCGYGEGRWLYVISRGGEVWDVSDGVIGYADGLARPDMRWLGDRWAVITMGYPALTTYDVHIIARTENGWARIYNTRDPGGDFQRRGLDDPLFRFEDGYRVMTVTGFAGSCALERRYEWQEQGAEVGYVLASQRTYGLWTCN
jgi:hypothetical protein